MCCADDGTSVSPSVDATDAADPAVIEQLVIANHILFDQGVVDGFGHVSVRHDKRPDRFLLARNMAPGQVSAGDIIEFTLHGEPVDAGGRRIYLERFIHGELYKQRLDVNAIVHSHSHAIVALSVVKGVRLQAIFHMAGFVGQSVPVFEIRDFAGDASDLLISTNALGTALAGCFADSDIALMRGHGSTVVGHSIPHAIYRAVYAELNARYQLSVATLGDITYLTPGESAACVETIEAQMQRPWDLWAEQSRQRRAWR